MRCFLRVAVHPSLSRICLRLFACSLVVLLAGCALGDRRVSTEPAVVNADLETADNWSDPEPQTPARLEDCWGPGRTIGVMTGTWASKDPEAGGGSYGRYSY